MRARVVRTLKDKHLGSLAPLESSSSREKGEESPVMTAPTSVVLVVVAASSGRGRAERIPARSATCPPPTLSVPRRYPSTRAIASTRARDIPPRRGCAPPCLHVCVCVRARRGCCRSQWQLAAWCSQQRDVATPRGTLIARSTLAPVPREDTRGA